jgi:hypothetical protein
MLARVPLRTPSDESFWRQRTRSPTRNSRSPSSTASWPSRPARRHQLVRGIVEPADVSAPVGEHHRLVELVLGGLPPVFEQTLSCRHRIVCDLEAAAAGGVRRPVSTLGGAETVEAAVLGGVVGGVVLPDAPDDAEPGAAEDAECVGVVFAAGDRVGVDLLCPGVVLAAAVGEDADGAAEVFVAGPAEAGDLFLAGLDGDGALAGERLERGAGGVAFSTVAGLEIAVDPIDEAVAVAAARLRARHGTC